MSEMPNGIGNHTHMQVLPLYCHFAGLADSL